MSSRAVLLINLGSPDEPTTEAVKRYLNEFLMDGYVIDLPYLLRALIVKGFILPKRPQVSAHAYQSIWTEQGSPLISLSKQMMIKLKSQLQLPAYLGMRYGNPSILSQLEQAQADGVEELLIAPLYPHYAMSTIKTTVELVKKLNKKHKFNFKFKVLTPFYNHPDYIKALAQSAEETLKGGFDHLVFSYHGLPERHLRKTDPTKKHCLKQKDCCEQESPAISTCYRAQTIKTTKALTEYLNIPADKYSIAYQSRLGQDAWLKPYTDKHLDELAKNGIKNVLVICPAFVADCLETLEEIGIQAKESFIKAGGESLTLVPCLNDHGAWVNALTRWSNNDWNHFPEMT